MDFGVVGWLILVMTFQIHLLNVNSQKTLLHTFVFVVTYLRRLYRPPVRTFGYVWSVAISRWGVLSGVNCWSQDPTKWLRWFRAVENEILLLNWQNETPEVLSLYSSSEVVYHLRVDWITGAIRQYALCRKLKVNRNFTLLFIFFYF